MSNACPPPSNNKEGQGTAFRQSLAGNCRRIVLGVLRLRRVQVALVTIVVTLLVFWFPMLESLREQLLMVFAAVMMVALGGYTVNDALLNGEENPQQERLEALLEDLVEELQEQTQERRPEVEEEEQVYDAEA
jgi:hypothetical protein